MAVEPLHVLLHLHSLAAVGLGVSALARGGAACALAIAPGARRLVALAALVHGDQVGVIVAERDSNVVAAVAECAVVGIADAEKGQVPVGLLLMKDGINQDFAALQDELVQSVRNAVGPIANFKRAIVVPRLPKTRSGKILRQVIRKMIDGQPYTVPSTIDDPAIVEELLETLTANGWMD